MAENSNIAKKVPFYNFTIADNFPTSAEIQNFFNIESSIRGTMAIGFVNDGLVRSTLYYCAASSKYGGGVIVSYYGDVIARVKNSNGTVTIDKIEPITYIDITDSTPVNVTAKASAQGKTIDKNTFVSAIPNDANVICLPYQSSNNYFYLALKDTNLNAVTGSKTIRVYYRA